MTIEVTAALDFLFPDDTTNLVNVFYNESTETTMYTLLYDLEISTDSLEAVEIPTDNGNIVFDGNGKTITYVDEDGNETTNLRSNGIFKTSDTGVTYTILIQSLHVKGGRTNDDSGFICSSYFGTSLSSSGKMAG